MQHHVSFDCSALNLLHIYGKTQKAWCTHTNHQGEGGKQGDPLMPLPFSVGQHDALSAIQRGMREQERLFAYLDDIWLVSKPERVGDLLSIAERELWGRARIRIHSGKTHIWNRSGRKPADCDELQRRAEMLDEEARVWTGSEITSTQQGIKVLGCPLGHEDLVRAQLEATTAKHSALLQAIPNVPDVQSARLLLLYCASARANYQVRVLRPDAVEQFARPTMRECGNASVTSCRSLKISPATSTKELPHCLCRWEALG